MNSKGSRWWFGILTLLISYNALGDGTGAVEEDIVGADSITCQDARIFERLATDICWTCVTPIRIMGVDLDGTGPSEANSDPLCTCDTPFPGTTMGFWLPRHLSEAVGTPGCSPSLMGQKLPLGSSSEIGGEAYSQRGTNAQTTFRHVHHFQFPVGEMMGLMAGCPTGGSEFSMAHATELVPHWNDDLLAFVINTESALFANAPAIAACIADAANTGIGGNEPISSLYWCGGSWGSLYPKTGNVAHPGDAQTTASLQSARLLSQMHRWGIARKTLGNECGGVIHPTIPKAQYKFQQYWPYSESNNNHYIGESAFRWGTYRWRPGHDHVNIIWRWDDCCLELF